MLQPHAIHKAINVPAVAILIKKIMHEKDHKNKAHQLF